MPHACSIEDSFCVRDRSGKPRADAREAGGSEDLERKKRPTRGRGPDRRAGHALI